MQAARMMSLAIVRSPPDEKEVKELAGLSSWREPQPVIRISFAISWGTDRDCPATFKE